jgi:hypothetical protein
MRDPIYPDHRDGSCCGGQAHDHDEAHDEAQGEEAGGCCGGEGGGGGCCGGKQKALAPLTREQIAALPFAELLGRYRRGVENFDRRVFLLSEEALDIAFLPDAGVGQWPVRVLLGHLADAEIANTYRMRRAIAEDRPVFDAWDENAFIDSNLYGVSRPGMSPPPGEPAMPGANIAGFVAVIHTMRIWTADWARGLTEEKLDRKGLHPEKGELSVRSILAMTTWHLEHHAKYLNLKLEKLAPHLAPDEEAGACGSGGGCGCSGGGH